MGVTAATILPLYYILVITLVRASVLDTLHTGVEVNVTAKGVVL
jgi:hypothetical protein